MRTVEIPDEIYEEAVSRAAAREKSVEAFVLDALTAYLDDGPIRLTLEQLEKVDRAESDIDAGRFYTAEQVDERFATKRATWIRENVH